MRHIARSRQLAQPHPKGRPREEWQTRAACDCACACASSRRDAPPPRESKRLRHSRRRWDILGGGAVYAAAAGAGAFGSVLNGRSNDRLNACMHARTRVHVHTRARRSGAGGRQA
ncbi:hypothetical protein R5R35_012117 [Gryllus longicercus]|uniref:Uncharacterized protein n=1 Tax=Gryllus longicercus TaxID=2509291 RepID=A0AAN9WLH2_9ORTH